MLGVGHSITPGVSLTVLGNVFRRQQVSARFSSTRTLAVTSLYDASDRVVEVVVIAPSSVAICTTGFFLTVNARVVRSNVNTDLTFQWAVQVYDASNTPINSPGMTVENIVTAQSGLVIRVNTNNLQNGFTYVFTVTAKASGQTVDTASAQVCVECVCGC